jgi:hypothetical protein
MAANTANLRVGRLLEIRAEAGYRTVADVDALFDKIGVELSKLPDRQHITVVDWRRCPIMAPEAADRIGQRIASTNSTTVRSAALADSGAPVAVLQFLRVIRDAGLPDRKLFFEESELIHWLEPILTPAEATRLRDFLMGGR